MDQCILQIRLRCRMHPVAARGSEATIASLGCFEVKSNTDRSLATLRPGPSRPHQSYHASRLLYVATQPLRSYLFPVLRHALHFLQDVLWQRLRLVLHELLRLVAEPLLKPLAPLRQPHLVDAAVEQV